MKRTDAEIAELLTLQAEASRCGMTIGQYLAAQQWSALFDPQRRRQRRRRRA